MLAAALLDLRLTPAAFWALTPHELAVMLGRRASAPAFDRAAFAALYARYPDRPAAAGRGDAGQPDTARPEGG